MAINKITAPAATPAAVADYQAQNNLIAALSLAVQGAQRVVGSNIAKGAIFYVGGSIYMADADTSISGTASDYVKLTVSGTTLVPSYVADLTGVSWSSTYNGYYDASGNLYVFDELKALSLGTISTAKMRDIGLKNLAAGWATALITALGSGWLTALGAALGTNWTTILAKTIIDFSAGAAGSYSSVELLPTNETTRSFLIPAGLYNMTGTLYTNGYGIALQIKDGSGNWVGSGNISGLVLADGTNYRLYNTTTSGLTAYYRKLL